MTDEAEVLPPPTEVEVKAALFRVHKASKEVLKRHIAELNAIITDLKR